MRKEWYIRIEGASEGPYSISDLKKDPRLTPDTLAIREGMQNWLPIKDIPELKEIFEEKKTGTEEEKKPEEEEEVAGPERILEMSPDPNYLFYIILVVVLIVLLFLFFNYF